MGSVFSGRVSLKKANFKREVASLLNVTVSILILVPH